jgi:hypothetical protein
VQSFACTLNQLYFMSDFLKSKIELYALIVIFVVCSIWVLDIRSLVPPDEDATQKWHVRCS